MTNEEITRHMPLVERVARGIRRRLPPHVDLDDLLIAGSIGLYKAIVGYDSDRGLKFSTYATWLIRGHIFDELRNADHAPREMRRNREVPVQHQLHAIHCENLYDREPEVRLTAERRDEVQFMLDRCSPREREIMTCYYLEDMPMPAIARRLGISSSRVSQIHIDCIARLTTGRRP